MTKTQQGSVPPPCSTFNDRAGEFHPYCIECGWRVDVHMTSAEVRSHLKESHRFDAAYVARTKDSTLENWHRKEHKPGNKFGEGHTHEQ